MFVESSFAQRINRDVELLMKSGNIPLPIKEIGNDLIGKKSSVSLFLHKTNLNSFKNIFLRTNK